MKIERANEIDKIKVKAIQNDEIPHEERDRPKDRVSKGNGRIQSNRFPEKKQSELCRAYGGAETMQSGNRSDGPVQRLRKGT